jgi:hypothetical protein
MDELELGPKMRACSARERAFVIAYLRNGGNGAAAAREAKYSDHLGGDRVRAHELLHRERVLSALDEVGRKEFRGLLIPAITAMRRLLDSPDHPDHARSVQSLLSRLGFSEKTTVDVTVSGQIELNHTDQAVEDLRVMLDLGIPEEKLIETFGYSGLGRYRKMVESKYGKGSPQLIEGHAEPPGMINPKPTAIG